MATKYTTLSPGLRARVHGGKLYVEHTDMSKGMVVSGGHAERVYRIPFNGSLYDAIHKRNKYGVNAIERAIEDGTIVRYGRTVR